MFMKIYKVSTPAFQIVKDGKPFNKWVGYIWLSSIVQGQGRLKRTITVYGKTAEECEKKLDGYCWGELVDVDENALDPELVIKKGGNNASTNR